jgi:hypothetical protein
MIIDDKDTTNTKKNTLQAIVPKSDNACFSMNEIPISLMLSTNETT